MSCMQGQRNNISNRRGLTMNDRQYNNIMKRIRELERRIGSIKKEIEAIKDNTDGDTKQD